MIRTLSTHYGEVRIIDAIVGNYEYYETVTSEDYTDYKIIYALWLDEIVAVEG